MESGLGERLHRTPSAAGAVLRVATHEPKTVKVPNKKFQEVEPAKRQTTSKPTTPCSKLGNCGVRRYFLLLTYLSPICTVDPIVGLFNLYCGQPREAVSAL
jgi:hypothetical protein